jgi:hypothetical protein
MSRLMVLAGDFPKGEGRISADSLVLPNAGGSPGEQVPMTSLQSVEVANEETARDMVGTLGWGAAGALLLGPVGLLAGLFLGGRTKEVTFVARFRDGRKLLGTTDSGSYTKLLAAVF